MKTIDLVIPMVFPQDREWEKIYNRYHGSQATTNVRFRSWNTEELLIKCCTKYMPWLRRIYILLAGESQVQPWMSSHDVHIVFHRDFIPAEYLPCFSSPCIEMFLHRIPELSETFIYANDDMFPLSPLKPEVFFRKNGTDVVDELIPCQAITEEPFPASPNSFHKACQNGLNMIAKPFGKQYTTTWMKTGHSFAPYLKSVCEEVWRRHGSEITKHLSPISRKANSYNQYLYAYYQHHAGIAVNHAPREQYIGPDVPTSQLAEIIRDPEAGIVCLNDNGKIFDWQQRAEVVRGEIAAKLEQPLTSFGIMESRNNEFNKNKNTKIFICTHTDFDCPVHNPVYEIADTRKLFASANSDGVDELFYSELRTYHHLAENVNLPQNVGFCQYRKYYEFMDNVPDLETIIRERGCITAEPLRLKTNVYNQYDWCFYFGDMDITKAILYETAPDLYQTFKKMLDEDLLYIGNMFIMPRENFLEAMQIVWTCLQHYLDIVGKDIRARIEQHPQLYLRRGGKYGTVEHQYRFGGSLGERIMSAYIMHYFKNPMTYKIRLTENTARPYRKLQNKY
jgi:hypothetical protein